MFTTRLRRLGSILSLFASLFLPLSTLQTQAAEPPPNIIVILADDLGWADLGCYGSSFHHTPHLDRMAREGIRFTDAYAACTVCSPTRAALMTGKAPARLHLTDFIPGRNILPDQKLRRPDFRPQLPLDEETLAERLKAKGYRTACLGKWHLGGAGFEATKQGFDMATPDIAGFRRNAPFRPGAAAGQVQVPGLLAAEEGEELSSVLTRSAIHFIDETKDAPFFLYLPHVSVHIPLHGRPDLVEKHRKRSESLAGGQTNAIYAAMLESLDEGVGKILTHLRERKLDRNTLVIFTSDNGGLSVKEGPNTPATSNAPLRAGKGYLYEGGLRVPLIAWWPGTITSGRTESTPVITMDVHATLLELAGLDSSALAVDGRSLASALKGKGVPAARPLFWHYPHYSNQGGRPGGVIREGQYKLIEFYESGYLELYDLAATPGETRNLATEMPDRANGMARQLNEWRKSVAAQMPVRNTNYVQVPLRPEPDGTVRLPGHEVIIHGVNVRYEPPAHKNTIGYWTKVEDWVSWELEVTQGGEYEVEILQGCGKGSGGSEVDVSIASQTLHFVVQDTGHFQNFVRRTLGKVQLTPGRHTLAIKPQKKPGVAVMDVREMVLKPVGKR
jgi:arylsulfatase A